MRKLLMISAVLSLTACAGKTPIVSTPPAACAKLIPKGYSEPLPAASIPTPFAATLGVILTAELAAQIVAPWAKAYVETSGTLEKANGRTADSINIVKSCEDRVNAARPK